MPDPFPPDGDLTFPQQVILDRLKVGGRWPLPGMPDLEAALQISLTQDDSPLLRGIEHALLQVKTHVYKENLPPETIKQSRLVRFNAPVTFDHDVIDGPWQRWKYHHLSRHWYRWLLGWWLRPPRFRTYELTQTMFNEQLVVMEVDLRRYRTYPESALGPPSGSLGSKVVLGHYPLVTSWYQEGRRLPRGEGQT